MSCFFKLLSLYQMKDDNRQLLNKSQSIVLCHHCGFFPTHDLHQLIQQQTIYNLSWRCPYCQKSNTCSTDLNFKYYLCNSNQALVDSTLSTYSSHTLLLIDAGTKMGEPLPNLLGPIYSNKGDSPVSKAEMASKSKKLSAYLQVLAVQTRLKNGKYFNWNKLIRKNQLSKIQYALWLADRLQDEISNIEAHYFLDDLDKSSEPESILNHIYLQKISVPSIPKPKIQKLTNLSKLFGTKTKIIIISSGSLKLLQQHFSNLPKSSSVVIINLEQVVDQITLAPTSTSHYLYRKNSSTKNTNTQAGRFTSKTSSVNKIIQEKQVQKQFKDSLMNKLADIKIFDHRLYEENLLKDWFKIIMGMIKGTTNQIGIFVYRQKKNSKDWAWQKLIDKEMYKKVVQKQNKDKVSGATKLFASQRSKQADIIQEFNNLTNKNTELALSTIQQFLNNSCNIITNPNKNLQVRIYLKYETNLNQQQIKNTVIWTNLKLLDIRKKQQFICLDSNETQHICRECEDCKRLDEAKNQQYFEL